ncbi:MAG: acyl-CoA thioesterase [Proteobacteria bacterium]|nr:MAG: acyl-CoA thioesterase [Pseudomonadota bacterium]
MVESGIIEGSVLFPVYYEDTDLSGFVYHANYLKFFERAREHVIGVRFLKELYDLGAHFVVHKASMEFKAPAKHGDQLLVESKGGFSRSPAIHFEQNAYVLENGQKRAVVLGQISIVVIGPENKPIRMPDAIMKKFADHKTQHLDLSGY